MTTFPLIIAPLLALQNAGQEAIAIKNDTPETWTVEYPRIVSPFIDDYRRCLNQANRVISGMPDFEDQHREDLNRCKGESQEAQTGANRVLGRRGEFKNFTPSDISEIFDHIGRIHIARGADLDKQFMIRLTAAEGAAEEPRPKGLVIELHDASVVTAQIDETAQKADQQTPQKASKKDPE